MQFYSIISALLLGILFVIVICLIIACADWLYEKSPNWVKDFISCLKDKLFK